MEDRLNYAKVFLLELFTRFQQDKCSSVAAELTITSLLALVPLTTLVFALLALIPNFEDMALKLQQYLFAYFIPASGESIQNYLIEFVEKAKSMSGVGFLMLFITALMMMRTIDKSFNHIWKLKKEQSKVRTFLVYWAVLTLGPIALGASIVITSYINSLPIINEVVAENSVWFKNILPLLMASIAFTVMYYVIPNRKILIKHALASAFIAALLFEIAKSGFGLFVKYFSTYELVFGALAAIPLFLIWIYVSWNIVLFGAEVCFGLSNNELRNNELRQASPALGHSNKIIRRFLAISSLIDSQSRGVPFVYNELDKAGVSILGFTKIDLDDLKSEGLIVESTEFSYCLLENSNNLNFSFVFGDVVSLMPDKAELLELKKNFNTTSEIIEIIEKIKCDLKQKLMVTG